MFWRRGFLADKSLNWIYNLIMSEYIEIEAEIGEDGRIYISTNLPLPREMPQTLKEPLKGCEVEPAFPRMIVKPTQQ